MKPEREAALRRIMARDSGASEGERANARAALERAGLDATPAARVADVGRSTPRPPPVSPAPAPPKPSPWPPPPRARGRWGFREEDEEAERRAREEVWRAQQESDESRAAREAWERFSGRAAR